MALALLPLLAATGRVRRFNEHVNALLERLPSHTKPASTTHFFSQTLDHFGDVRKHGATWRQRCYVDASFWRGPGAPVFLYIGGEGPQGPVSPTLFMHTLAQRHGALMLALEHRFYGESWPTPDMSNANLQYLSSEQAHLTLTQPP